MFRPLYNAFIAPIKDQKMSSLYAALGTGVFGFAFIDLFFILSLASLGAPSLIVFFTLRFVLANLMMHPAITIAHNALGFRTTVISLSTVQALIMIYVAFDQTALTSPYLAAIFLAIANTPYWHFYHLVMTQKTSDHNRGNEVSIANILTSLAAAGGSIIAGTFADFHLNDTGQWTGTLIIILATILMGRMVIITQDNKNNMTRTAKTSVLIMIARLKLSTMKTASTIFFGVHQALTSFLLPVWLFLLGFDGLETGLILAATILLKLIFSPFVGHLANQGAHKDIRLGCALKIIGWTPWLIITDPLLFGWSLTFWALGAHFHDTGIISRWYAARYNEDISGREMCLGMGRIIGTVAGVSILFNAITVFPALGLMIALLALGASYLPDKPLVIPGR